jgi:hypothetical protein
MALLSHLRTSAGRAMLFALVMLAYGLQGAPAHARCGGLPRGWQHSPMGHEGPVSQVPGHQTPLTPRCSGPFCSEAPPAPSAPVVVSPVSPTKSLLPPAVTPPEPGGMTRVAVVSPRAPSPLFSGGIFRPPRSERSCA